MDIYIYILIMCIYIYECVDIIETNSPPTYEWFDQTAGRSRVPFQDQLHICLREPAFLYGQLPAVNLPMDLLYGFDKLLLHRYFN